MKDEMRTLELHVLIQELQFLLGAKVEKVFHPEPLKIILHLHVPNLGKQFLHITLPSLLYLSSEKGETPEVPSGFCVFLRKKLINARLQDLVQKDSERIVEMIFSTKDALFHLFLEFFGKGNLVLCDEQQKILSLIQPQSLSDRVLRGGIPYEHPSRSVNVFDLSLEQLQSLSFEENISKTLAINLGMGRMYAEELCVRAKIDVKATQFTQTQWKSLHLTILSFLKEKTKGYLIKEGEKIIDIVPYLLHCYAKNTQEEYTTFHEALNIVFSQTLQLQQHQKKQNIQNKKLSKVMVIIDAQTKQIEKMEEQRRHAQRAGELLYEHYQEVSSLLHQMKALHKTHSWDEIKKMLQHHSLFKDINETTGEITIEIPD